MSAPAPVSTQRLRDVLAGRDLSFGEYDESELAVPATNAVYFLNTSNPQVLQLRAHWRGVATDDEHFQVLMDEIAMCNSTRTGPKASLAPFEDGETFGLVAEWSVLTGAGLTGEQLDSFVETGMSMIMGFLHDLEEAHPDMVTWKEEGR